MPHAGESFERDLVKKSSGLELGSLMGGGDPDPGCTQGPECSPPPSCSVGRIWGLASLKHPPGSNLRAMGCRWGN